MTILDIFAIGPTCPDQCVSSLGRPTCVRPLLSLILPFFARLLHVGNNDTLV
jgi:hypothetical protein